MPCPRGFYKLHPKKVFNFQLNRWYSLGFFSLQELQDARNLIRTFSDWVNYMIFKAKSAEQQSDYMKAAMFYRAAEFYEWDDFQRKDELFKRFKMLFYRSEPAQIIKQHDIPFGDSKLFAIEIQQKAPLKGTLLIHGGFDSFIEEFYHCYQYFAHRGWRVIAFEGPGQGTTLRTFGLHFNWQWEKPVSAILNTFDLDSIFLYGISMGGWLSLRAAAFESRVRAVAANGHAMDYMKSMNRLFYAIHMWFYTRHRDYMTRLTNQKFSRKKNDMATWMVQQLMFITGRKTPMEALEVYLNLNEVNMRPDLINQHVLLLAGSKDHFVPPKMLAMQEKALIHARSVTTLLFTPDTGAAQHCQTGNIYAGLEAIAAWLENTCLKIS